ncbi:MAG: diadenylate cyclase CdaA [Bacteroidota bacterium]
MSGSLFEIGFLPIRIWDILDILIVGYLIYQFYKLLHGSIAFNIFVGVISLFALWWLVGVLQMDLLSSLLNQIVSVGVLMLLIVFQPEVRRFLLILGNNTLRQRSNFIRRLIDRNLPKQEVQQTHLEAIRKAILRMSKKKTGALIVFAKSRNLDFVNNSGIKLDAQISQQLLESIFNRYSPLHDGAVVIEGGKIVTASSVLPLSSNTDLPDNTGLRHRAGLGATEHSNVGVVIISEENGRIAFANNGKLQLRLTEEQLQEKLKTYL